MTIYSIIALAYAIYSFDSISETVKGLFKREVKFSEVLKCNKCCAFWVVLLMTWNLEVALLVSLCVLLMESFIVTKL